MSILQCVMCDEEMTPPIAKCMSGHNLCVPCRDHILMCPVCHAPFGGYNLILEVITPLIKKLRNCTPPNATNDLLRPEFAERNIILRDLAEVLLRELKCKICAQQIGFPIGMCFFGHVTCPKHGFCPTCFHAKTEGRNFVIEAVIKSLMYACPFQSNGCDKILTLSHDDHKDICQFKPIICPLRPFQLPVCNWMNSTKNLIEHLRGCHANSYKIMCGPHFSIDVPYYSDQFRHFVILAFNRVFFMSIVVKNNVVNYKLELLRPMADCLKFNCINQFIMSSRFSTTCEFPPSPYWRMFEGGSFMGGFGTEFKLKVTIQTVQQNVIPQLLPQFHLPDPNSVMTH